HRSQKSARNKKILHQQGPLKVRFEFVRFPVGKHGLLNDFAGATRMRGLRLCVDTLSCSRHDSNASLAWTRRSVMTEPPASAANLSVAGGARASGAAIYRSVGRRPCCWLMLAELLGAPRG